MNGTVAGCCKKLCGRTTKKYLLSTTRSVDALKKSLITQSPAGCGTVIIRYTNGRNRQNLLLRKLYCNMAHAPMKLQPICARHSSTPSSQMAHRLIMVQKIHRSPGCSSRTALRQWQKSLAIR